MKIAKSRHCFAIRNSFFLCFFMVLTEAMALQSQEIPWLTDLNQGIAKAEAEKKLVLLHFTASWSNPCKEIDSFVFTSRNVERAVSNNVIPVRIDVENQPEIAAEYGVAKVPYDIVITPNKRIVYRRHSPKDSANYALMIQRLERTIQSIAKNGMSTINQNLDDLKQLEESSKPIQENPGFVPAHPNHQAAAPSEHSQEMNRKFGQVPGSLIPSHPSNQNQVQRQNQGQMQIVANPFADSKPANQTNRTPGPLRILNEKFYSGESNGVTAPAMQGQVAAPKSESSSTGLVAATMQPNLQKTPAPNNNVSFPSIAKPDTERKLVTDSAFASSSPAPDSGSKQDVTFNPQLTNHPAANTVEQASTEPTNFALKGNCPVALIQEGRWVSGDTKWGCVHRGQTYTFASEKNLKTFQNDPDAYSPLLSGYDPVVYASNGELIFGKEEHGVFMGKAPNLRVVLFRDSLTRKEFENNPKKYIQSIRVAMENSGGGSTQIR